MQTACACAILTGFAIGCGGSCPTGKTHLDGTCVDQATADNAMTVRNRAASFAKCVKDGATNQQEKTKELANKVAADVELLAQKIKLGTEFSEQVKEKYKALSDENVKAIIDGCLKSLNLPSGGNAGSGCNCPPIPVPTSLSQGSTVSLSCPSANGRRVSVTVTGSVTPKDPPYGGNRNPNNRVQLMIDGLLPDSEKSYHYDDMPAKISYSGFIDNFKGTTLTLKLCEWYTSQTCNASLTAQIRCTD